MMSDRCRVIITLLVVGLLSILPTYALAYLTSIEKDGRENVYIVDGKKSYNLTKFKPVTAILSYKLSGDGEYAFVWHESMPPKRLSIYRIKDRALLARFAPGWGGDMTWMPGNRIMHTWGGGMGASSFAFYSIYGQTLRTGGAEAMEMSPSKRFFASYALAGAHGQPLEIYDTQKMEVIFKAEIPVNSLVDNAVWRSSSVLDVKYSDIDTGVAVSYWVNCSDGCFIDRSE